MSNGPAGDPVQTEFVPDRGGLAASTQHVPDLPSFGRYRVLGRLGAGAMGTVYRAEDDALGRAVAIKVLHPHSDPATRERFLREARAISALVHPNILAMYDGGSEGETPHLVMELAPGGSLRDRLQSGPLPIEAVCGLGIQIARALAAAHGAGILHRDVKPANILAVEQGRWKLADFGIARVPDSALTRTGEFLGSPSYAAPESLRAGVFSPASDVYALGATLYEAVAGAPPHGHHDASVRLRELETEPPPLHERCAVPRHIADAIMAALARDPAQRPSAEALAGRLAEQRAPLHAPPVPGSEPRSRKRVVIAGAVVGAVVLAAAILASGGTPPAASSAQPPRSPVHLPQQARDSLSSPVERAERAEPEHRGGAPVDEETPHGSVDEDERADDEPRGRRGHKKWKQHKGRRH